MKTTSVFFKIFFSGFFILLFVYGHSQYNPPKIIPPSPTAASLGNFGDIPIGYYTGTPDISVPLYEIKTKDLSVPITLSYDATGVRVAQDASWVGLNWSLSVGGLVSRVVRGKDDFGPGGYYVSEALPNSSDLNQYYANVWNGFIDGEPDIFSYNFAGYSGKFLIDKAVNGGTIFMSKRNNLDIKFVPREYFIITTPEGNQYYFGTKEVITNRYTTDYQTSIGPDPSSYAGLNQFVGASEAANSSWYLDRITSPSGDTIRFIYKTGHSLSLVSRSLKKFYNVSLISGDAPENGGIPQYTSKVDSRENIEDVMLERIEFTNGRIEFETTAREDIEAYSAEVLPQKLSGIKVYNNSQSTPVKDITLGQSYFTVFNPNGSQYYEKRLRLDYVQINQDANKYSFSYYKPDELPSKYSRQVDEWGFYTSDFDNPFKYTTSFNYPDLYPRVITAQGPVDGVPQQRGDAIGEYVKRGILTSITYPTKGRTEFDYEPNDYGNGDPIDHKISQTAILDFTDPLPVNWITGPENAIQTITLTQNTSVLFSAATSYTSDPTDIGYLRNSNGDLLFTFTNSNNVYVATLEAGQYTIEAKEISGQMTRIDADYDVIEYVLATKGGGLRVRSITNYDANNNVAGKKTFEYNVEGTTGSSGLLLNKAPNYYYKEIDYNDGSPCNSNDDKKGFYLVRSSNSLFPDGFYSQPNIVAYSRVSVKDGINGNNGTTIYNYYNQEATDELNANPYPEAPAIFDSRNGQLLSVEVRDASGNLVKKIEHEYVRKEKYSLTGLKIFRAPFEPDRTCTVRIDEFVFQDLVHPFDNFSEWYVESQITDSNFFNNGVQSVVNTTINNYDNAVHKQITSSETIQSDNTTKVTYYKYPHDFSGQQPYTDMVNNKHIWAPVIEQSTFKTAGAASTFLNSVKTNYDFWDGSGWASSPTNIVVKKTVESRTGIQPDVETRLRYHAYDNIGNVATVSMENNVAKTYLWGYNKMYPVAEITNADYPTAIQYVDQNILNNPPDDETFRQHLNNLRNIPEAQVTTYTYNPLVGMTSSTDVNGRTTYYEYDDLGRLSYLRDQDRNILKKYCYNFAGQPGACDFAGNTIKVKTYTKSGCDPALGQYGSSFTYTVAANTYFGANADALAQEEADTKGQAYADANGTCLQGVTNDPRSGTFTRTNCGYRGTGGSKTYLVDEGKYAAATKLEANQLAEADVAANGQSYANANGGCTFSSNMQSGLYTKNDCIDGGVGSDVTDTVPEGKYTSTISLADANTKAINDLYANGQNNANANGYCTWTNDDLSGDYYTQFCGAGKTIKVPYYESIPPGMFTSTISVADANNKALQYAQEQANEYGECTSPSIYLYYESSAPDWVSVEMHSTSNYDDAYYFDIPSGRPEYSSGNVVVKAGYYDITFIPGSTSYYHDYLVGCDGFEQDNWDDSYTFSSILITDDCNSIDIGAEYF
jgi:YD repeat-containing protein